MMVQRIVKLIVALGVILLLLQLSGVFHTPAIEAGPHQAAAGLAEPTHTASVDLYSFPDEREAIGTVAAATGVKLAPEVGGRILEMMVDVGDVVHVGQLVARLDDRNAKLRTAQAASGVAAAEAAAKQAAAAYQRTQNLYTKEAATKEMLEAAEAQNSQAQAAVAAAQEQLAQAELYLSYAEVLSPAAGMVLERLADPGDLAAPGRPLLLLQGDEGLEFQAEVRAGLMSRLAVGQELRLRLDHHPDELLATVTEIQPAADPRTRSVRVTASIPEQEGLRPGIFGRLYIPDGEQEYLMIPKVAVQQIGQLESVLVQGADGRWGRRHVRIGQQPAPGSPLIPILSGLQADETVGWND